jgi:hypothetical protein
MQQLLNQQAATNQPRSAPHPVIQQMLDQQEAASSRPPSMAGLNAELWLSQQFNPHWSIPVLHLADYLSNSITTGQSQFFIWLTVSALFFSTGIIPVLHQADCLSTSFFNWSNSSLSLAADYLGLSSPLHLLFTLLAST